MPALGVVLDACVLFPMPLRDTLLRAAEKGIYRLYWSAEILDEVRRNLAARGKVGGEAKAQRAIDEIRRAFPEAEVLGYESLTASMTNHPKDRHVLAAAVKARAQVIVTFNLKDFRGDDLEPFGVVALSPDTFLSFLLDLAPDLMAQIVVEQARQLRNPPMSALQVLAELAKVAPRFAARVRPLLPS